MLTGCDVRMFGCLPLDGPRREGRLFAGLWTYFALKAHNLNATTLVRAPNFGDPTPSGIAILRVIVAHRRDVGRRTLRLLEYEVMEHVGPAQPCLSRNGGYFPDS